jgi:hypothetical protein
MPNKVHEFLHKGGKSKIEFFPWKAINDKSNTAIGMINWELSRRDEMGKFGALFKICSLWIHAAYYDDMVYYQDAWEVFGDIYAKVHNGEVTLRIGLGPDDERGVLKLTYMHQLPDKEVVEETLFKFVGPNDQVDALLKILRELIPGTKTGPANVEI